MAWVYCNTSSVLTKATTKWVDDSPELRVKALVWLNEVIRDILNQPRTWWFLKTPTVLTITAGAITLPTGCGEVISIEGDDFFFVPEEMLTDEQVFDLGDESGDIPVGYIESGREIIFYPTATGTVTVRYEADLTTDYLDVGTDTILPINFENLLIVGVRAAYYDYDKDGRYTKEEMNYDYQMRVAKAWDNKLKPRQQKNPRGYTRIS
jgi:hypothetical protein